MPRASKQQMAENRAAVVDAASVLLRERGSAGVSIDAVCAQAGLTHGGFYKQFSSREALLQEALDHAADQRRDVTSALLTRAGDDGREALVHAYLSPGHRDDAGHGCVVAALLADAATTPTGFLEEGYTAALQDLLTAVTDATDDPDSGQVLADVALLVGAVALARATRNSPLSDAITRAAVAHLTADPTRPSASSSTPPSAGS